MSLLGFPLMRYIDNDSEEVLRAIQLTDDEVPLDIVLHTPGGLVLAATQIARAIQGHRGKVTVFVPHYAMSGGTLIALAADEIVMCRHSVLGPIDPQLGGMPAASIVKVAEEKPIAEVEDQTLVLADVGRKAIAQVEAAATRLLAEYKMWRRRRQGPWPRSSPPEPGRMTTRSRPRRRADWARRSASTCRTRFCSS